MDKYIQIFIDFIPNDKSFVDTLIPKYEKEFRTIGDFIERHSTSLKCKDNEFMEELFDFLDGNGFEVIRPRVKNPYDLYPIQLIPIYERTMETLTKEIEKENEKLKAALEKLQSTLSEYVPVQETVLCNTSVEMDEGPVLECEELYTPRPIWICLRRLLEFFRLVSAGWGGSTTLPRPP